jgi:hypothetical protein
MLARRDRTNRWLCVKGAVWRHYLARDDTTKRKNSLAVRRIAGQRRSRSNLCLLCEQEKRTPYIRGPLERKYALFLFCLGAVATT